MCPSCLPQVQLFPALEESKGVLFCFSLTVPVNTGWTDARVYLNGKRISAERQGCQSYVREDLIAALDFYIGRELSSLGSEKSFWRGIKTKQTGTLYVVEILFTLGHSIKMIFILQK